MSKKEKTSYFKYYYTQLYSHQEVSPQNVKSKKFLFTISFMDIAVLLFLVLLCIFKSTKIVTYFTNESNFQYNIYVLMLSYAFVALTSYTIYHIVSYNYEIKHKHELLAKDITGYFKLVSFIYKLIHFPWISITCIILKILEIFRIQNLKEFIPMILCGYIYFLMFSLIMLQVLCNFFDELLATYDFLTNSFINDVTYLYFIVFVTIFTCKQIPTIFLKKFIKPSDKNSLIYKKIFRQYDLLNYYFLVVITLILRALNFSDDAQTLIDALFYTTNALALFSTARQKATNA
jgi:hypothetical protein